MSLTNTPALAELLATAVTQPGVLSSAYRQFHNYSLGNPIPEKSAQRSLRVADQILRAGRAEATSDDSGGGQ